MISTKLALPLQTLFFLNGGYRVGKFLFVFVLLLSYIIATLFQLYLGGDMMHKVGRRKPEPTLLLSQGIFNFPHHIYMVADELVIDDAVDDSVEWIAAQVNVMALSGFISLSAGSPIQCLNQLNYLLTPMFWKRALHTHICVL